MVLVESFKSSFVRTNLLSLSGNFRFDCEAPQYDGSVKSVSVSGGNFDVKTGNIL